MFKNPQFNSKVSNLRDDFSQIIKNDKSLRKLCIEWAIDAYSLKCMYLDKEKTKEANQDVWVFKEPMESAIKPFKQAVNQNPNKLASTALVQFAQTEKPSKGSHSRNYKYAAAFQYAHNKGWNAEKFAEEIKKKGGLSRLVKLYTGDADSLGKKSNKKAEKSDKQSKTNPKVKPVTYYADKPKEKVYTTKTPLPKVYVEKIVVARIHNNSFEILGKYPGQK